MSIETTTKLATVTVGAGGIASVSFSNIPQTYTDLKLVVSARSTRNNATYPVDNLNIAFNGASAGVSVAQRSLYTYEATGSQIIASGNDTYLNNFMIKADGGTASTFSSGEVYVSNYTSSNVKPISMDSVAENNSTKAWLMFNAGVSLITAPITSIQMYALSGNLVQHSTFTLYGVKAMRTAVGSSIKATGGTISFDGTYVTHTFNSTGLFTPTANLLVDYLVVAGGAGGAGSDGVASGGGGGGAGGLRSTVTATGGGGSLETALSLTSGTGYAVTIGSGGAAGGAGQNNGSNGSNSAFSSITSTGGGGGSWGQRVAVATASNGGSGGGGGSTNLSGANRSNGGAGTASQGYEGGYSAQAPNAAAGGGGAGQSGREADITGAGRAGGFGVATSISGTSITYAGGGGGGNSNTNSINAGGIGGGGAGARTGVNATSGTSNTGGGGGGGQGGGAGAAGGSGIVIVRYKA
jgi:hypothetical protein